MSWGAKIKGDPKTRAARVQRSPRIVVARRDVVLNIGTRFQRDSLLDQLRARPNMLDLAYIIQDVLAVVIISMVR